MLTNSENPYKQLIEGLRSQPDHNQLIKYLLVVLVLF